MGRAALLDHTLNSALSSELQLKRLPARALAQDYETMSRKRLQDEVTKRRLSQVTLNQDTMQRDPAASSRKALQKRLRDSDDMFDKRFPKEDLLDVSAKKLRTVATALHVNQGDRTRSTLIGNLVAFADERWNGHVDRQEHRASST